MFLAPICSIVTRVMACEMNQARRSKRITYEKSLLTGRGVKAIIRVVYLAFGRLAFTHANHAV
jgi:hypothetical protein